MSRSSGLCALAVGALAVALVALEANAQPPRGGPGGGFGMMGPGGAGITGLLRNSQVREELNLTDAQVGKLTILSEELREQAGERFSGFRGLRDLSEQERQARMEEFREQAEKLGKEIEAKVKDILTREQFQRLKQIELQQQGVRALLRDDIVEALGVTSEQKEKLESLFEENRERMQGVFQGARDMSPEERAGLRDKMEEIRKDLEGKAMAVLSDEQKTTLQNIMGKPFELERPQRGFGGGEGDRGRRGDRGDRGDRGRRGTGRQRPEA